MTQKQTNSREVDVVDDDFQDTKQKKNIHRTPYTRRVYGGHRAPNAVSVNTQ